MNTLAGSLAIELVVGQRVVSPPAVSDGRIFIRTDEAQIAVGG